MCRDHLRRSCWSESADPGALADTVAKKIDVFATAVQLAAQPEGRQFARSTGIRPKEDAGIVVVVRIEIVPDERRPAQYDGDFAQMFAGDLGRDDLRTGPKDVHAGVE